MGAQIPFSCVRRATAAEKRSGPKEKREAHCDDEAYPLDQNRSDTCARQLKHSPSQSLNGTGYNTAFYMYGELRTDRRADDFEVAGRIWPST